MSTEPEDPNALAPDPAPAPEPEPGNDPGQTASEPEPEPELGDGGKKALEAERRARRDAERQLAELRKQGMTDQEKAIEEARADERRKGATQLLNASILARAAGRLQDPSDAIAMIASKITIADDGTFDDAAIASEIDDLIRSKPYLAVGKPSATPAPGSANGGPQGSGPAQWTESDLQGKTPEQIEAARVSGLLNTLLGIT